MVSSQTLFRRHRNREADEGGGSAASAGGGGGDGTGESSSGSPLVGAPAEDELSTDAGPSANTNRAASSLHAPSDGDTDEEQELIVQIPQNPSGGHPGAPSLVLPTMPWEPTEQSTALRREAIHREVERVQRANFVHFLILCLVPTALLFIVIAAIVSEDGDCSGMEGSAVVCEREPRSFVNAFTSRCICEAVRGVAVEDDADVGEEEGGGDSGGV